MQLNAIPFKLWRLFLSRIFLFSYCLSFSLSLPSISLKHHQHLLVRRIDWKGSETRFLIVSKFIFYSNKDQDFRFKKQRKWEKDTGKKREREREWDRNSHNWSGRIFKSKINKERRDEDFGMKRKRRKRTFQSFKKVVLLIPIDLLLFFLGDQAWQGGKFDREDWPKRKIGKEKESEARQRGEKSWVMIETLSHYFKERLNCTFLSNEGKELWQNQFSTQEKRIERKNFISFKCKVRSWETGMKEKGRKKKGRKKNENVCLSKGSSEWMSLLVHHFHSISFPSDALLFLSFISLFPLSLFHTFFFLLWYDSSCLFNHDEGGWGVEPIELSSL